MRIKTSGLTGKIDTKFACSVNFENWESKSDKIKCSSNTVSTKIIPTKMFQQNIFKQKCSVKNIPTKMFQQK